MSRKIGPAVGIAILAVGAVLGVGGGVFIASVTTSSESSDVPSPTYKVNATGMTYGSAALARSSAEEPDLIQAVATNGEEGYVKKKELDRAAGAPDELGFKSPEDALRWQEEAKGRGSVTIHVYAVDGKTIIGDFTLTNLEDPPSEE